MVRLVTEGKSNQDKNVTLKDIEYFKVTFRGKS